MPDDQIISTL